MAGGILPALKKTEATWFGSILYPLTSADSLAVMATLTAILWLFTILVPEYCLTLMSDADGMGVSLVGKLIALISILPVAFLLPFAIIYWLQYLGRVIVSSGMGELIPPRTPDRNFEGFFSGLSPWIIWLLLGVAVGMLPAAICRALLSSESAGSPMLSLALVLAFLPYVLMALLMTFLHDDAFAAMPLERHHRPHSGRRLVSPALGVRRVYSHVRSRRLRAVLLLRNGHFVVYLLACVGCWALFIWISIVVVRVLGNQYHRHRQVLRWNHERPRWGVAWKL